MDVLDFFLSDLRNGRLPESLKSYILPAELLAFSKDGTKKPRPIAVGEIFYRLITTYAVRSMGKNVTETILPIQLGAGVEGGVETAHHFMNTSLTDSSLGYCAISADGTNAFNSR